jgi:carboxylate-amine ligase
MEIHPVGGAIPFHASPGPSLGIEVELSVVDTGSRQLANAASVLLESLGAGYPGGEHPKAKHELFECTIEIITDVCATVSEARVDLEATLAEVSAVARPGDLALICAATHPFSHWSTLRLSPNPRYVQLVDRIQWPARRLAIHGIHYHVGVRSGPKAVAITNALAFHLPVFLALSASSPFWHGLDTGMASVRTKIFEGLPTAGLPPSLDSYDDFEAFMATLLVANAIESVREVWWDVRPHPNFGTVELRMCDAMASIDEIAGVAALAQSLVFALDRSIDEGRPLPGARDWVVRENKWLAARHGLDASIIVDDRGTLAPVRDVIGSLLGDLAPFASELRCADELASIERILDDGPGYARQRRVVDAGGTLVDVVDDLIDRLGAEVRTS